jgi:hypothetical protein
VLSPYLWGFSSHYKSGKYIADGTWSDTAVSKQCGAALLLRRMVESGHIEFLDQLAQQHDDHPLAVGFGMSSSTDPAMIACALDLQRWLNTFPGIT